MDSTTESVELTPIQKFYSNTKVLITGATGFFGKILLEKLLRSCPEVSTIYILVRQRREKDSKSRTKEIMDHILFQRIKKEQPNFADKVIGIDGDCSLPNLGLNSQDIEILKKEVNIIFHLAATVNFMEKLKVATFLNIRGTRDIISLAQDMPNLKVFMHASSVYSNCVLNVIEEKMYPPAFDGNAMIVMAENLSDSTVDKISDALVGEYPNTYVFTKNIAEGIVNQNGGNLPIGVHRSASALSTYRDPIKSWTESLQSAPGLIAYICLGIISTVRADYFTRSAVVPVDMCINSLIAAAWHTAAIYQRTKSHGQRYEIPIYQYESNSFNPIIWGDVVDKPYFNSDIAKSKWPHYFKLYTNVYAHKLHRFVAHLIPAFFLDFIALILGKPPRMINMYLKIHKLIDAAAYFTTNKWTFKSNNVREMIDKMSDRDRDIFFCDLRQIDWDDFFKTYMQGIKLYVLKSASQTNSKKKQKGERSWMQFTIILTVVILLLWFLWY